MTGVIVIVIGYMYFFRRESLVGYWKDKQKEIEEKTKKYSTQLEQK